MATHKDAGTAPDKDAAAFEKQGRKEQLIEVEITRDWWDEDENRVPAGTKVKVPLSAALDGIESGALRRPKKGEKPEEAA